MHDPLLDLKEPMNSPRVPLSESPSLSIFLEQAGSWIQAELMRRIPDQEPRQFLYELMRDYPQRGGKKFRSSLVLLVCEWLGGRAEDAILSAVALELFQNFVLIHDDIEDASLIRRGLPTLHLLHGIPLALNAGDTLMGLVSEVLLENQPLLGSEKTLEVMAYLSKVFRQTFEGQAIDIGWITHQIFPDRRAYQEMITRKTGWYSGRGPCQCGALIAGASAEIQEQVGRFGEALGIGFQLRDDLLNLTTSDETQPYGKERGGDIAEGKRTLITIELAERLGSSAKDSLEKILLKPREEVTIDDIEWCIEEAHSTGSLEAVRNVCAQQAALALEALEPLPEHPAKELLKELTSYLALERIS